MKDAQTEPSAWNSLRLFNNRLCLSARLFRGEDHWFDANQLLPTRVRGLRGKRGLNP